MILGFGIGLFLLIFGVAVGLIIFSLVLAVTSTYEGKKMEQYGEEHWYATFGSEK